MFENLLKFWRLAKIFKSSHWGETPCVPSVYKFVSPIISFALTFKFHTGEKPYSCPQSSRLQLRLRNHTGEKPFICFVQNRSLGLISSVIISTQVSAADPLIVKMILLWTLVSSHIFAHETSVHPILNYHVLITFCFIFQNISAFV